MTALLRNEADMIAAYQARIQELQLTYATVDAISGLPDGYTAKLMAKMKGLGEKAIEGLNGALGVGFVVAVDREQCERVSNRWVKRRRPFYALERAASSNGAKREEISDKSKQCEGFALMQILGRSGGKASGKKRRAIAARRRALQRVRAHAARMRWSKCRQTA